MVGKSGRVRVRKESGGSGGREESDDDDDGCGEGR